MSSKHEMVAEIVRRELNDVINEVIADGHCQSLSQAKASLLCGVEYRISRRYVMLEISDTINWHPRKVGKDRPE